MTETLKKTSNYTADQVSTMIDLYQSKGNDGLEEIALQIGKSVRSVRSKLVREGVYVAAVKASAAKKDAGPSKKDLLNELEALLGFSVTALSGSTKEGIQSLIAYAKAEHAEVD
jgi:hypothetical protein